NLKEQIMTTNVWVQQFWEDYKLRWDPKEYGGVDMLHVPSDHIWKPDIVLYNNLQVDLRHEEEVPGAKLVEIGIDLSDFYLSVEWDVLEVPAIRNEKYYTCCEEPYIDITFNISMRRKTLFYTVNLIIPCMGISFLTVLVFYLPSDSGQKVTLSISILLALTLFFLLLAEIIPPTSLTVPLLGKYLLFTMILVTLSIIVTVVVLNVHFRTSSTHRMNPWVKRVFMQMLPRLLLMRRPLDSAPEPRKVMVRTCNGTELRDFNSQSEPYSRRQSFDAEFGPDINYPACRIHGSGGHMHAAMSSPMTSEQAMMQEHERCPGMRRLHFCPEFERAMESVHYIADHTRRYEEHISVREDWKYVAMVLDRLFLWIFTIAVLVGTCGIILHAPTLYDNREPVDVKLSEVAMATRHHHLPR
ncbi:acetylcholine receptor subunit alpha-like, partial [Limulus polyphemus]|uniref:Acetylcholine receptor subunit alpha-like n=1 Tax=Limulus polyphemus TaxID=6850 RepID=A0ABM1TCM4_LIMPO